MHREDLEHNGSIGGAHRAAALDEDLRHIRAGRVDRRLAHLRQEHHRVVQEFAIDRALHRDGVDQPQDLHRVQLVYTSSPLPTHHKESTSRSSSRGSEPRATAGGAKR